MLRFDTRRAATTHIGLAVGSLLVEVGWVTIDDAPVERAFVRLKETGRAVVEGE